MPNKNIINKSCEFCKEIFLAYKINQKYCSKSCWSKHNNRVIQKPKICPECNVE